MVLNIQVMSAEPAQNKPKPDAQRNIHVGIRHSIGRVDKKWNASIRVKQAEHSSMWDGRLDKILEKEHINDFKEDVQPFRYNQYRSGHKEREFDWGDIKNAKSRSHRTFELRMGIIHRPSSQKRRNSPILRLLQSFERGYPAGISSAAAHGLLRGQPQVNDHIHHVKRQLGVLAPARARKYKFKTAFCSYESLDQFKRMPLGLTNPLPRFHVLCTSSLYHASKNPDFILGLFHLVSANPAQRIKHLVFALNALRKARISQKIDNC